MPTAVANPTTKKGINFKQTPVKKMLLIHPETFKAYLDTLTPNASGWVAFDFNLHRKLTRTALFADVTPEGERRVA